MMSKTGVNWVDVMAIPAHSGNIRVSTGSLMLYTVHDEDPRFPPVFGWCSLGLATINNGGAPLSTVGDTDWHGMSRLSPLAGATTVEHRSAKLQFIWTTHETRCITSET